MRAAALFRPVATAGERLLDRILCVAGAVLASQAPEFFQQYTQRLGGHLDEARRHLGQFSTVASRSGQTPEQLARQLGTHPDPATAGLGGVITDTQLRVQELATAEQALREADVWSRPFVFFQHVDRAIAQATFDAYKPAVPTTYEGLIYALAGMLLLLLLYHGFVRAPLSALVRRRRTRTAVAEPVAR